MNKIIEIYALIFSRKAFYNFNFLLFQLSLRGLGILNYTSHKVNGDRFLTKFLKKNYKIDVVVDVGANGGDYAELYRGHSKQIFCFEPHPETVKKLKSRFHNSSNVKVIAKGLSDNISEAMIYDYDGKSGTEHASLYSKALTEINQVKVIQTKIELETLDHMSELMKIDHINLLKIDTEGNEYKCLLGANRLLSKGAIDIIHFEFNDMNVHSGVFMNDFVELLTHYNLYRLLPNGFLPLNYKKKRPLMNEIFAFQNIVAFKKELDKSI